MNSLVFNSRAAGADVAWIAGDAAPVIRAEEGSGAASRLPVLTAALLAHLRGGGPDAVRPDVVIASVGPGSFTGVRAALSVAQGYALGAGLALVGVSVDEALAMMDPPEPGWTAWTVLPARRDHVYLNDGGGFAVLPLSTLAERPAAGSRLWLAGGAAEACAALLAARTDISLRIGAAREPDVMALHRVGLARLAGDIPPRPALPVYAEEARIKAGAVRPAPVVGA